MLEQAKNYLSRVVPWTGQEYVGLHYTILKEGMYKPVWLGKPVANLKEATNQLAWLLKQNYVRDIYVSMASQKEAGTKTSKTGQPFKVAIRSRENAGHLKSLFLDIDVKDGGYASTTEAGRAVGQFVATIGLPKPSVVVGSGSGGLHVYWTLANVLTLQEWQPLADALCRAAQEHGLKFDSQCTVDSVRILRIPGTLNCKLEERRPVTLEIMRDEIPNELVVEALQPYMATRVHLQDVTFADVNDELTAGMETPSATPRDIHAVASVCPWIKETLETNGVNNANPLWFLSLRIATFCKDTEVVGHTLSSGHHGYLHEETQIELERLERDKQTKSVGFPSCKKICESGAPQCANCPNVSLNSSPLSLAPLSSPSTALVPSFNNQFLPEGYRMDAIGHIWSDNVDADGVIHPERVIPFVISDPWTTRVDGRWHLQFTSTLADGLPNFVSVRVAELTTKDSIARCLGEHNITILVTPKVQNFMVAFLQKLQAARDGVVQLDSYGWNWDDAGKYAGFTYAGKCYSTRGVSPAPHPHETLLKLYSPKGASAHWLEAAKLITKQKRPALDALFACAFAGPLIRLIGGDVDGVAVGGISRESGIGKSTTLKIAQAVWGNPNKAMAGTKDTENSVFNKAGKIRHLPIFWDEIKTAEETRSFVSMIFQLTGGKEKSRSSRDGSLRDQKSFNTILAYASNESLYDAVLRQTTGTTAGHMRMFEFVVPQMEAAQKTSALNKLVGDLYENYGHAGAIYSEYIGKNYQNIHDLVEKTRASWEKLVSADTDERMWVVACTTMIAGAHIANLCGLTEFDEKGLRKFLHTEFMRMRETKKTAPNDLSKSLNVMAILGEYLSERKIEHSITTNKINLSSGRPKAGEITVEGEGTSRMNKLRSLEIQFGRENGILRISDAALGTWLKLKGYGKQAFLSSIKDSFGAVPTYGRLGSGTDYADPVTRMVWQISIPGTELEEFMEIFTKEIKDDPDTGDAK